MSVTPEYLIERSRNKTELKKWKIFAIIAILIIAFIAITRILGESSLQASSGASSGGYIARINIEGIIMESPERNKRLASLAKDDKVKAVIVHINSTGGSTTGSEMIYNAFRKISEEKPIVSVLGSVAASGGYMAAIGTDQIFCYNSTITGSIGVIMQVPEITELAEKIGITFNSFKSSPLKAAPNPVEKLTDEVRDVVMESVFDVYDFFIGLVSERRGMTLDEVKRLADGRIYTGRQALKIHLVDAIGSEEDAVKWLQENRDIDKSLEVEKYHIKPRTPLDDFFEGLENRVWDFVSNKIWQGILGKNSGFISSSL